MKDRSALSSSSKKDKLLENAQKFILKGQLDRAVKEYEQIVAYDPNEIRHRQRLAELLVRVNRKDEAITEYESIGKYYTDNCYYLKAIAVYKQVQKLAPENMNICFSLASLNEKQGLVGNAIAEYSRAYSYYENREEFQEALEVLDKMAAIDPDNLGVRLKLAETRYSAGHSDKAYEDMVQLAVLMSMRGDVNGFRQIKENVSRLFPEIKGFGLDIAKLQIEGGAYAASLAALREITGNDRGNLDAWHVFVNALEAAGEREELKAVYQRLSGLFPKELFPSQGNIRCLLEEGDTDGALDLLELYAPSFINNDASETLEGMYLALHLTPPKNARVLQGLKTLYETTGDLEKLATITARMALIPDSGGETETISTAETGHFFEEGSFIHDDAATVNQQGEWEEEIAIELPPLASLNLANTDAEPELEYKELEVTGEARPFYEEPSEEIYLPEFSEDDLKELFSRPGIDYSADMNPEEVALAAPETSSDDAAEPLADLPPFGSGGHLHFPADVGTKPEGKEAIPPQRVDKYSTAGILSAFKTEINQQLDAEDTETHYNLGFAYKEMGLFEDAISEFRVASVDPLRRIDCITLQGICCREKGESARSEEIFKSGITLEGVTVEELSPLKYELALLYDAEERKDEALALFLEIWKVTPSFRDVANKVRGATPEVDQTYDLDLVELENEVE